MLKIQFIVGALFLFSFQGAQATIYFVAHDPVTRSIGMAYSSSGGSFWQTKIKGKGLLGEQAYGLCDQATPGKFLNDGLSAPKVVRELYQQCHAVGYEAYRVLTITTDGAIDWVIADQGCHAGNQYCGAMRSDNYAVVGGGLNPGILEAALNSYAAVLPTNISFGCKLLKTLRGIYAAGGEIKDFKGASVTVDDPNMNSLQHWEAKGEEVTLLPTLQTKMQTSGLDCN